MQTTNEYLNKSNRTETTACEMTFTVFPPNLQKWSENHVSIAWNNIQGMATPHFCFQDIDKSIIV